MNNLSFIFGILVLISFDIIIGFVLFNFWRYFDFKYFSKLEIIKLKEENNYLKIENKKISGISTDFWSDNSEK